MRIPLTRRLALLLLASAQLALIAVGPFIDPPPAPEGHRHHIAAESSEGCHPYHDEHCVVCRVISAEALAAPTAACAPLASASHTDGADVRHAGHAGLRTSPVQPRAPPVT